MRSSKSRSRSKSNRSRSVGNIVNRVFDSSGPEGKVRGTPQQIIEKYAQLARDATLGNDRVAAENFQQHAEHYTRLLGEAQREQDARREQQEAQNRDRQRDRHDRSNQQQPGGQDRESQPESLRAVDSPQPDVIEDELQGTPQPDIVAEPAAETPPEPMDLAETQAGDSGLVETPESKPQPTRSRARTTRTRSAAKPKATAPKEAPSKTAPSEPAPSVPASDSDGTTESAG